MDFITRCNISKAEKRRRKEKIRQNRRQGMLAMKNERKHDTLNKENVSNNLSQANVDTPPSIPVISKERKSFRTLEKKSTVIKRFKKNGEMFSADNDDCAVEDQLFESYEIINLGMLGLFLNQVEQHARICKSGSCCSNPFLPLPSSSSSSSSANEQARVGGIFTILTNLSTDFLRGAPRKCHFLACFPKKFNNSAKMKSWGLRF